MHPKSTPPPSLTESGVFANEPSRLSVKNWLIANDIYLPDVDQAVNRIQLTYNGQQFKVNMPAEISRYLEQVGSTNQPSRLVDYLGRPI